MPTLEELIADLGKKIEALADKVDLAARLDRVEARLAGIETNVGVGGNVLAHLLRQGGVMSIEMDAVRTEVAGLRDDVAAVDSAIDALAARLENNPTPAEAAAVAADLRQLRQEKLSGFKPKLDGLDPDVATGPIVDNGDTDPGDTADEGGAPA